MARVWDLVSLSFFLQLPTLKSLSRTWFMYIDRCILHSPLSLAYSPTLRSTAVSLMSVVEKKAADCRVMYSNNWMIDVFQEARD